MFDRRLIQNFDWILLLLLILIGTISVLNLYSATYLIRGTGGSQIYIKQIYWFLIGFAVFLMMTTFDYSLLERLAYPFYVFSLALLILVLVAGKVHSGSQRWLSFGGISFQPSEFAKIAIVLTLAKFFNEHGQYNEYRLRDLWQPFLLIAFPAALIIKEPDPVFRDKLEETMRNAEVEFRRGSSGGGNQLRQPYLKTVIAENEWEN